MCRTHTGYMCVRSEFESCVPFVSFWQDILPSWVFTGWFKNRVRTEFNFAESLLLQSNLIKQI